ncbi:MAG: ATP-grasp domain-containing protein [Planctomycetes bacterium]|nr:ATP-grasp domain-containing protein [Planctomycetota bacterium]
MRKTTVLLTCIGGTFVPDTIEALRADPDLDLRIVGVDANPEVANRFLVDSFHVVPGAAAAPDRFLDTLREICHAEEVEVVLPSADEEVVALARVKSEFRESGVRCAVEESGTVDLLRDKARLFARLAERGVPLPGFALVSVPDQIEEAARSLGYPGRKIVLKPPTGRGSRGLVVVDPAVQGFHPVSGARHAFADLASVVEQVERERGRLPLLAMEFMPGPDYDVDCIARQGEALCVVPRRRLWKDPFLSVSQGCRIERHPGLEEFTRRIVRELSLSHAMDLDVGLGAGGAPGLYEINPRWSGAVAASRAGGVNVPAILLRTLLDLPVPAVEPKHGTRMFPVTRMAFVDEASPRSLRVRDS